MVKRSAKTNVLWAALLVLGLAGGTAVVGLMFMQDMLGEMLVGTSIAAAVYGAVGLVGGMVVQRRPRMGWWCIGLLGLSFLSWIVLIWFPFGWAERERIMRVVTLLGVLAALGLQFGILSIFSLKAPLWKVLRLLVGGCSTVAGLLIIAISTSQDVSGIYLIPTAGVLVLLGVLGTVMVPVVSAIEKSSAQDEQESDVHERLPVEVRCPRCETRSTIRSNTDGTCEGCGLEIRVTITEPRCECGYLLYNLTGEVCPECGRSIACGGRWNAESSPA